MIRSIAAAIGLAAFGLSTSAVSAPVTFTAITTGFPSPIGIDYYEPDNKLIVSSHYPTGSPNNLELVGADGSFTGYSGLSGLTDELKVATVRSGYTTGFAVGTAFTGNGSDGEIVKVDPGGGTFQNPWVSLPGFGNGLIRGSLYVDRTGVYNGDLLVVTTAGQLWRIDSGGNPTQIGASVGVHLEGLSVIPNDPARWGAKAGCIVAGAEGQNRMHTWCPDASVSGGMRHEVTQVLTASGRAISIEDIDVIDGGNFFGVNFGTGRLIGAAASEFAGMVGDILLTEELFPGGSTGLHRLFWNGTAFATEAITAGSGSPFLGQWEHVTFANAGVREIPPVGIPVPATGGLALLGLGLVAAANRRRAL